MRTEQIIARVGYDRGWADALATLRARIEAMPAVNWRAIVDGAPDLLRRDDVLAELDQHTQEGGDQ